MQRDMDLIRELLLSIETTDEIPKCHQSSEDEARRLNFHLLLLREAKLVAGFEIEQINADCCAVVPKSRPRLTWAGHEFLDAARSDTIWRSVKSRLGGVAGTVSFAVLTQILIDAAKEQLGMKL